MLIVVLDVRAKLVRVLFACSVVLPMIVETPWTPNAVASILVFAFVTDTFEVTLAKPPTTISEDVFVYTFEFSMLTFDVILAKPPLTVNLPYFVNVCPVSLTLAVILIAAPPDVVDSCSVEPALTALTTK